MLDQGADPNKCDPDDNAFPIHYALNHGHEMVQVLIDHGAHVNIPSQRSGAMPLALAESHGYVEVASILRKAGARLRTGDEDLAIDPRLRLQIEPKISMLVVMARINFRTENPEQIAKRVEEKLNLEFPGNMPFSGARENSEGRPCSHQEAVWGEGPSGAMKSVPSPEEAMAKTDMSEDELTRRFLEHLIQQGKNPFKDQEK